MNLNNLTASRIRDLRKDKGYTIDAVARDLGISRTSYSQMENGHVEITLNRLEAVANFYKVPVTDILPSNNIQYEINNGNGGHINTGNTVNNFFANTEEKLQFIADNLLSALEEMRKKRNNENG